MIDAVSASKNLSCFICFGISHIYHTSDISEIFHIIMEPSLVLISRITKNSFDFKNRLDKHRPNETTLITCDIKSLYTNIQYDLFYRAVPYWIEKLQKNLLLLRRYNKQFILKGLSIISEFNCF